MTIQSSMHFALSMILASTLGCATELTLDAPEPPPVEDPPVVEMPEPPTPGRWVGPELSLDAPVEIVADSYYVHDLALAFDGEVYLAAWLEDRDNFGARVRAARLSTSGQVLDPQGILLASNATYCASCGGGSSVSIAAHDGQFLVAWSANVGSYDTDVRYGRVRGSDGVRLDPIGGRDAGLQSTDRRGLHPSVAAGQFNDETFWIIAYEDRSMGSGDPDSIHIELVRFRAPGASDSSFVPPGVVHGAGAQASSPVVIRTDDDAIVVAWKQGDRAACDAIRVARLGGADGYQATTVRDATMSRHCTAPALAAVPGGFVLAWREADTILAQWFETPTLTPRRAEPQIVLEGNNHRARPRLVAHREGQMLVVAEAGGTIHDEDVLIARFDSERTHQVVRRSSGRRPAVAAAGDRSLVIWNDRDQGLDGVFVGAGGEGPSVPDIFGRPLNAELSPASAFDGRTVLTAWLDTRPERDPPPDFIDTPTGVYAVRTTPDGSTLDNSLLDDQAFEIARDPDGVRDVAMAADRDEGGFVVVWATKPTAGFEGDFGSEIVVTRVGAEGTVGEPRVLARVDEHPAVGRPVIARGVFGYVVVWERGLESSGINQVHAVQLDADLAPSGEAFQLSDDSELAGWPAIASDGERVLVTYALCDDPTAVCFNAMSPHCASDIRGVFVDDAGSSPFDVSSAAHCELRPSVASHEGTFLVVWEDARDIEETSTDIYGTTIGPGETRPASPQPIVDMAAIDGNVRAAADDLGFSVLWSNYGDLRVTRVDEFGRSLDTQGLLVTEGIVEIGADHSDSYLIGTQAPARFSMTALGRGEMFVVYDRLDPELANRRVKARLLTYVPEPDPF